MISRTLKKWLKYKYSRDIVKQSTEDLQAKNKSYFDLYSKVPDFKIGDIVLVNNPVTPTGLKSKLYKSFIGPYYITDQIRQSTFRLRRVSDNKLMQHPIHADRLRKFHDRSDYPELSQAENMTNEKRPTSNNCEQTNVTNDENTPDFEVDKLTNLKFINRKRHYFVVWKDKNIKPRWVFEDNIPPALRQEFHITRTRTGLKRKRETPHRFRTL